MSCLKNLLILILVVGVLIYITEESKQKEKFSVIKNLLKPDNQLSSKQISSINSELDSESSRNSLISELNSENNNIQKGKLKIEPVQEEINYAPIDKKSRVYVEEEGLPSEYSKFIDDELDRRISYNTDKNRINQQVEEEEDFKKYLYGKKNNNQNENINQEGEYNILPYAEEETLQRIKSEIPESVSKYVLLAEEEQQIDSQRKHLAEEHNRVKNYEEELGITRSVNNLAEEESIYNRRMAQVAEDENISRQRRAYTLAEEDQKARIYAEEEQRAKYLLIEEEEMNARKEQEMNERKAEIKRQRYIAEEEQLERQKYIAEEEQLERQKRIAEKKAKMVKKKEMIKRKAMEQELHRKKYIEEEEAIARRKEKKNAMKKQKVKYVDDEKEIIHHDYTYLDQKIVDKKSLNEMKDRHQNQVKCGTFIDPKYTNRINGFAWKNVLDEKDYHPYDSKKEPEEPESLRDAYNSMIPKLNQGKNPHTFLNTHGTNTGTTMKTCSNGYSIYDENANHKNKTGGVYSNDVCFDPHSSIN